MTINAHALASQIVAESDSPDPAVMADQFVARLPKNQYKAVLLYLSRHLIRDVIRSQRADTNGGAPNRISGSGRSRKVEAVRESWRKLLATPEFVPSLGEWVFLRDATADQVLEMAGVRRQKAVELRTVADRYAALAQQMRQNGATRVGDLPDPVLADALGAAA